MEKLKNEKLKNIEIKIEGDNCIVSYAHSKVNPPNEVCTFPQLENDIKASVDLNLSLSSNSDECIANLKSNKRKIKDLDSNSKKILEITNKSIFYSESNIKISSSDHNVKINMNNKEKNNKDSTLKNSVIKKINFNLYENAKEFDENHKFSESDRIKSKISYLYNKKIINNNNMVNNSNNNKIVNYNINSNILNPKAKSNQAKKRQNSMIKYELKMNKKDEIFGKLNQKINKSLIRHRQNNSFVISNPFNNKKLYLGCVKNNEQYTNENTNTANIPNNKKVINKKKFKSPKEYNKNRNIKNNIDKLTENKSLIKSNNITLKSLGNFSLSKIDSKTSNLLNEKYYKSSNEKYDSNSKKVDNNKNERNIKSLNSIKQKFLNINKKNMFCIKKPNKKIIPYLTSARIKNINQKNEKTSNNLNKRNEYCSLKQYYHLKIPFLLNIKNIQSSSGTPIASTNVGTNCTNCSTLNTPSANTTKIYYKSNAEDKGSLMKYYSHNSFLKQIIHRKSGSQNKNQNTYNKTTENKNSNKISNQNKKLKKNIESYSKGIKINSTNKNNSSVHHISDNKKSLKSSRPKNIDNNKILLNKCNANDLQKLIISSNNKHLHKLLTQRNVNRISFNHSINNSNNKKNSFDENSNINYNINEFNGKQYL